MPDINEITLEKAMEIETETLWDCHKHDDFSQEHIEQCLDEMLAAYISDGRNYVVDRAEIECTEMSDSVYELEYMAGKTRLRDRDTGKIIGERDSVPLEKEQELGRFIEGTALVCFLGKKLDMTKVRRLYALHAKEADDNGIRYATVVDTTCLRNVNEGTGHLTSPIEGKLSSEACIVSCGNCKLFQKSDIDEIEKRLDESIEYGTCYSLIKPVVEWVNPLCAESVSGNCNYEVSDTLLGAGLSRMSCDTTDHHKVMQFDTRYGPKEGLTMLSTLLCTQGGVITIKVHGQIYLDSTIEDEADIEDRIKDLVDLINGNSIYTWEEMRNLSTVEILARLIYQESRNSINGQNSVLFSVINRLFTEDITKGTASNNIYSVITGQNQYQSVYDDDKKAIAESPNAYYPPIDYSDEHDEKKAWENAKRLAAIAVIALEDYGSENKGELKENDRKENIVELQDQEIREQIVNFIEGQENMEGNPIKNEIGTSVYFYGDGNENHFY